MEGLEAEIDRIKAEINKGISSIEKWGCHSCEDSPFPTFAVRTERGASGIEVTVYKKGCICPPSGDELQKQDEYSRYLTSLARDVSRLIDLRNRWKGNRNER